MNFKFPGKKLLFLLLTLALTVQMLPIPPARAASLPQTADIPDIETQIRAFADSVDQPDAADKAASALVRHGTGGRGKTLQLDETHVLTAALVNSELFQSALINGCTGGIKLMQTLNLDELPYALGACDWYGSDSRYSLYAYPSPKVDYARVLDALATSSSSYDGQRNSYDTTLDWVAGGTRFKLEIERTGCTVSQATYKVTAILYDEFDFSTVSNSGFKNLLSILGALFFREFTWLSTVTFDLTVPNPCPHRITNYRWTFDPENQLLISDNADGYTENIPEQISLVSSTAPVSYYHRLEKTVHLFHDRPWVLEYDVKGAPRFVLSPFSSDKAEVPFLFHNLNILFSIRQRETLTLTEAECEQLGVTSKTQVIKYDHGVSLKDKFKYSYQHTCTFRVENQVNGDGTNMFYLTVFDHDLGQTVLERTAMSEYYVTEPWAANYVPQEEPTDLANGLDLSIQYVGNRFMRQIPDLFELRIWENGKDDSRTDLFTSRTTPPTCSEPGYTTYTCSVCGDSYTSDHTPTAPHSYRAGLCTGCPEDTVTASITDGTLTVTGEFEPDIRLSAACYDSDGRFAGVRFLTPQDGVLTASLPETHSVSLLFLDENWAPLRPSLPVA